MEFSYNLKDQNKDRFKQNTENNVSERLQKALERNRRKSEFKNGSDDKRQSNTSSLKEKRNIWTIPTPDFKSKNSKTTVNALVPTRTGVARPSDIQFTGPLKRETVKKNLGRPSFIARHIDKDLRAKVLRYSILFGWLFNAILLGRLIFADRGILDYYSKICFLQSKHEQMKEIKADITNLEKEIILIQSDVRYQRKIVRDQLGFISDEEFLILFAKENKKILL